MKQTHLQNTRACIAEILECAPEDVTEEKDLIDDLGTDSLDRVEILMGLEDTYKAEFKDEDMEDIKTVGDIVNALLVQFPTAEDMKKTEPLTEVITDMSDDIDDSHVKQVVSEFRTKPIVVEAIQFIPETQRRCVIFTEGAGSLLQRIEGGDTVMSLLIRTPRGTSTVNVGDWVIKGVNGDFYQCCADRFEDNYEPFDDSYEPTSKDPAPAEEPAEKVPDEVAQVKEFRRDLDAVLQRLKVANTDNDGLPHVACPSPEKDTAIIRLKEAIMWLGMDLKGMNEKGVAGTDNPYPDSYNPNSASIAPPADGLGL